MTTTPEHLDWVAVSAEWADASYQLARATRNDCELSSASRDAFGRHLVRVNDALGAMAAFPAAGEGTDAIKVSTEYRAAVNPLADAFRLDCQANGASIETYSYFLRRLDTADADVIASRQFAEVRAVLESGVPLAAALKDGRVDDSVLRAVLQHAVEGHAPLKLEFKVDGEPEDQTWSAKTPIGIYEIVEHPRGCLVTVYTTAAKNVGRRIRDRVGVSREQAEAAAQSDFDTLVRGCLSRPATLEPTQTPQPTATPRRARP